MPGRLLVALVPACILLAGCSDTATQAETRPAPPPVPQAPALVTQRLPAIPRDMLAVQRGTSAVLVRLDGSVIARLDGFHAGWVEGLKRRGRLFELDRDGHWLVPPTLRFTGSSTKGPDCTTKLAKRGADWLVGCYTYNGTKPGTLGVLSKGRVTQLVPAPRGALVGHWQSAYVSPDGKQLLLGWSAECESPVAYLAPAGGGEPRRITKDPSAESVALGWARDGRAIVFLPRGLCGGTAGKPGAYSVGPGMRLSLIAAGSDAVLRH